MAHSDEWADAGSVVSFGMGLPINRLWVATLGVRQHENASDSGLSSMYLKVFKAFCQPRLHSTLILTHRKIISSPPRKSMPNCTTSPSLTGKGRDSTLGWLSRMWFRKVPEELLTSLMNHWPLAHQNSQCFRLTTLDLKPTGVAEGMLGGGFGAVSRSEYRPTRITESSDGSVLAMGGKTKEGRLERGS